MGKEDQYSVSEWIEESYPGASMRRRLKHAFEELTELALKLDPTIDISQLQAIVAHAAAKSLQQDDNGQSAHGEIGDVRIALSGIATAADIDEQQALDDVMAQNRARSLADRRKREAAKQQLDIFQP